MRFPSSLKVAILPLNGLFEVKREQSGKMSITGGLEAEFLQTLSKSLKFELDIVAPADGEWGRELENGSWTGLVGMVLRREADIAMGGIAVTEKRAKIIQYTVPYRFTYLTFATNLSPELPRFTAFLYPFTPELWISLAFLLLIFPFIFRLLLTKKMNLSNHIFETVKSLLYEPIKIQYGGAIRDYILLGSWLITTMFISYSYAATLLSFLTIPLTEPGVQNIRQLSELVERGSFRAGSFKGTNVINILKASHRASIVSLSEHISKNHHEIEPRKETVKRFYKTKNSALIAPAVYFQMNFPKTLRIAPEPLKCTAISIVTLKDFCCHKKLDLHISRIFESGLANKIVKRVLDKIEISFLNETRTDAIQALNLEDITGALMLLVVGTILSIIIFFIEILMGRFKNYGSYSDGNKFKKKNKKFNLID